MCSCVNAWMRASTSPHPDTMDDGTALSMVHSRWSIVSAFFRQLPIGNFFVLCLSKAAGIWLFRIICGNSFTPMRDTHEGLPVFLRSQIGSCSAFLSSFLRALVRNTWTLKRTKNPRREADFESDSGFLAKSSELPRGIKGSSTSQWLDILFSNTPQ